MRRGRGEEEGSSDGSYGATFDIRPFTHMSYDRRDA